VQISLPLLGLGFVIKVNMGCLRARDRLSVFIAQLKVIFLVRVATNCKVS